MECKNRVEFLQAELKEKYEILDTVSFVDAVTKAFPALDAFILIDIELIFRGLLDDLISNIPVNEVCL